MKRVLSPECYAGVDGRPSMYVHRMDFKNMAVRLAAGDYRKKMDAMAAKARKDGDPELAEYIMDYERNTGPEYRSPEHLDLYVETFDSDR